MKYQILVFGLTLFILACQPENKKSSYGVHAAGEPVRVGEFLKMEQMQTYNGKTILSTKGRIPMYQQYDTVSMIPEAYKAYTGVKIGDTAVYEVLLDSGLSIGVRKLVPKGGLVKVTSIILDILPDEESMVADLDVSKRKLEAAKER